MSTKQVRVRDCACVGTPHGEGDWVELRPTLSLSGGLAAEKDLRDVAVAFPVPEGATDAQIEEVTAAREADLQTRWVTTFIRHGAVGWNLTDEEGAAVPFSVDALLDDYTLSRPVADEAAELYTDAVLLPFRKAPAARSPTGPINGSTSATRKRTRQPSGPSLPGTSAVM